MKGTKAQHSVANENQKFADTQITTNKITCSHTSSRYNVNKSHEQLIDSINDVAVIIKVFPVNPIISKKQLMNVMVINDIDIQAFQWASNTQRSK